LSDLSCLLGIGAKPGNLLAELALPAIAAATKITAGAQTAAQK
jgi:hypothetical protein